MLQYAAAEGNATLCTPKHFSQYGAPRLTAHANLVADASISIVYAPQAAGAARVLSADLTPGLPNPPIARRA